MADLNVTKMVLKVDLQCSKCYRKIKKVLCRYPEIRDRVYDEKKNTVTITVVCCSPEYIKEKIVRKAGDVLESIEIVRDKPKDQEKKETEKQKGDPKTKAPETGPVVMGTPWLPPLVSVPMYPMGVCCCSYEGGPRYHGRGPMCRDGCGRPSCSDGCGRPSCQCSGGNRGHNVSRCNKYCSEENASGCSFM